MEELCNGRHFSKKTKSCVFKIKAKNFKGNKLNLHVFVFKKC